MSALNLFCVLTLTISAIALPINIENVRENLNVAELSEFEENILIQEKISNDTEVETIEAAKNAPLTKTKKFIRPEEILLNKTEIETIVASRNSPLTFQRNFIRPGVEATRYAVDITPDIEAGTFRGILTVSVEISDDTLEDSVQFYISDTLEITSVQWAFTGSNTFGGAVFNTENNDDDIDVLNIEIGFEASAVTYLIEYQGSLEEPGQGLYRGSYPGMDYLAMNLFPTNARRVFPCMDVPSESAFISFTFNDIGYNNLVTNSLPEDNNANQFRSLEGPPYLWSMAAHNLNNIHNPVTNVPLFIRPGVIGQDNLGSITINRVFNDLNAWTNKSYFEITLNQNSQLSILALPDVNRDWYGLSTIGIWEPHILMETSCSAKQRYTAYVAIAEALARQWFGYVIYPENFRFQWVTSGLASYAAFDVLRGFQSDPLDTGELTILDMNTLFVTEVIQESLYRDTYAQAMVLEPAEPLFQEPRIREHLNDILKYKAPALLRMLRLILGDADSDFIKSAGRTLLNGRALQTVTTTNFVEGVNSDWLFNGNGRIENVREYLDPFLLNNGYPVLEVSLRTGGVVYTMRRFSLDSSMGEAEFDIPLTWTTNYHANYDDDHIYPQRMFSDNVVNSINVLLEDEDFVLFNIQGQGYYRVNYDEFLWERMLITLTDPDRRAQIHPLNRATLLDDVLNLARGFAFTNYDVALEVSLSWEFETEYAPWKAFVRNMNYLRKRLVAMVTEDEDLDPDIYLRMVRRTIGAFEQEIKFTRDQVAEPIMRSFTRGLVMDHACRANYQPCIAAAVDMFYQDNQVNPEIPADLRPAVYCTMVREGGAAIIELLRERLEIEPSLYERVVILESLGCSTDSNFITEYLRDTISAETPYTVEERIRIFKAIAESSYENSNLVLEFIEFNVIEIREMYGGPDRLEEALFALSENMAEDGQLTNWINFLNSQSNQLGDSQDYGNMLIAKAVADRDWIRANLQNIYNWIDENDAPTIVVSTILILASFILTLFNH